jgi:Ca2+-binding EF-hand superfamily protein
VYFLQVIDNISAEEFYVDVALYTSTLKLIITACMDGVAPTAITELIVSPISSVASVHTALRGAPVPEATTKSMKAVYTIELDSTTTTYTALSTELKGAVASGDFNSYLTTYGNAAGADHFVGARSSSVTTTNLIVPPHKAVLTAGAIAGIVLALSALFALIAVGIYLCRHQMLASTQIHPRYMGGKSLLKYFQEDVWPALRDIFERLDVNEARGFEVFKTFATADVNEDGMVDLSECFKSLGGRRTKFTERIFHSERSLDSDGFYQSGLNFQNFLLALWNYCTLTPSGVARFVFEIYDADQSEFLDKADVESMFRMLYDTTEVEADYIAIYQFDSYAKVSKDNFCAISARKPFLIQPALDYQAKLRARTGGAAMWAYLSKHREQELRRFEKTEMSLDNAVSAIVVSSKGYSARNKPISADVQIQLSQKKIKSDAEMAERELKLQQRRLESESRSQKATAPDRKMHQVNIIPFLRYARARCCWAACMAVLCPLCSPQTLVPCYDCAALVHMLYFCG